LADRVAELEQDFHSGRKLVDHSTMRLLECWLEHHILGTDQFVAEHLRARRPPLTK
jgi:hemerythrin